MANVGLGVPSRQQPTRMGIGSESAGALKGSVLYQSPAVLVDEDPAKSPRAVGAMSGINGLPTTSNMKIEVFTKPNCPNCVTAKQLLKSKGMEFREINLDSDGLRAEFMSAYPDVKQMPQIFFDGQRVGGLAGLQVALNQLDLL